MAIDRSWFFSPENAGGAGTVMKGDGSESLDFASGPPDVLGPIIADALNVHEATGLTPSQLQARVTKLEAALSRVQKLTEWEAPDADSGAALNFNQGYESALEDVAAALKP